MLGPSLQCVDLALILGPKYDLVPHHLLLRIRAMSIGSLSAQVILDDPSRIHHGPSDPVRGRVELSYLSHKQSSTELFGRLVLDLTFHGRTKTKIWRSNGQSTITYRGRFPLLSITRKIYDDVVKMAPGEQKSVPFEISFPPSTQPLALDQGEWKPNSKFENARHGMALPPSMHRKLAMLGSFSAFIEYRIGCIIKMDGLHVDLCPPGKDDEVFVHYDSERSLHNPAPRRTVGGTVKVSNKELLDESDRPSGLKEKMKAAFSSDFYPTYTFDWTFESPLEIYNGSPTTVMVRITPRSPSVERKELVVPPVYFEQCSLEIKSITYARTGRQRLMPEQNEHGTKKEHVLDGRADFDGPFIEDNDWTKTITFEPVLLPSSFRFVNVRVDYTLKFSGVFKTAGKTETVSDFWNISVYPPLNDVPPPIDGPSTSSGVAGRSNAGPMTTLDSLKRDLMRVDLQPDLPREEPAPPMYDEAADDPPPMPTEKVVTGREKN